MAQQNRKRIPKDLQVRVFRRDRWICRWCGRPVIFPPAMRYLEQLARQMGHSGRLAYFDPRWRRDRAPLLDHLGAVIDHERAFSRNGEDSEANFVTSCNKCNARKSASEVADFKSRLPLLPVKGKYGEPQDWDGFSTLFVLLAKRAPGLTAGDKGWLDALTKACDGDSRVPSNRARAREPLGCSAKAPAN
jgi:5-methylcytosine-specific restriction endonuclease McrA